MLSKKDYEDNFQGYYLYDCAVRSKTAFSFVAFEDGDDSDTANKRLINYFTDKPPGQNVGMRGFTGFLGVKLAISTRPKTQAIVVARKCAVGVLGGGEQGKEKPIPMGSPSTPLYTSMHALTTIDGLVYAAGPWRAVCRRLGKDNWESIADRSTLPVPTRNEFGTNDAGFDAIGGFSATDIYCGGGHADLWRFDGNRWHRCALPTNMLLESICCAGDGFVYLGMQSGSVLRGRENTWELIHKGNLTLPFKDMVWFDNRVWCTSDYGIWTIENGKLIEPNLPPEVRSCSGNLSVGDGVMLLAGMYGATVYDGKVWTPLLNPLAD